jgi:micrococcal nuclease
MLFDGVMPFLSQSQGRWILLLSIFISLTSILLSRAYAKVVISEVMWMGSDLSTSDEWVELAGLGSGSSVDTNIGGYTLTSLSATKGEVPFITFGTGTVIGSGQYLVISRLSESASRLLSAPFKVVSDLTLPNTKLLLRLRDAHGQIVDEVDDGVGDPIAGTNVTGQTKASMERKNLWGPGNVKENWAAATLSLGFDPEAILFGTPGFPSLLPVIVDKTPPSDATELSVDALQQEDSSVTAMVKWKPSVSVDLSSQRLTVTSSGVLLVTGELPATSSGLTVPLLPLRSSYTITLRSIDQNGNISIGTSLQIQPYIKTKSENTFSIHLIEILPLSLDKQSSWIELLASGSGSTDLGGWTLKSPNESIHLSGFLEGGHFLVVPIDHPLIPVGVSSGTILLSHSGSIIDQAIVPILPPGVSLQKVGSDWTTNCMPSPGSSSLNEGWDPQVSLVHTQSGTLRSIKSFIQSKEGQVAPIACQTLWGDGSTSDLCSEDGHLYQVSGAYTVQSTVMNYCGTTVTHVESVSFEEGSIASSSFSSSSQLSSSSAFSSSSTSSSVASSATAISSSSIPSGSFGGGSSSSVASASLEGLVLYAALPNPKGTDTGNEWVEIWNTSSSILFTSGWSLVVKTTVKPLPEKTMAPGDVLRIPIPSGMTLGNTDGAVILRNPQGVDASVLRWTQAVDDEEISFLLSSPQAAFVSRVVDGDTFDVVFDADPLHKTQRIRLMGVDAPELTSKDSRELSFANESKKYVLDLIENKKVELQFDTRKKDTYGRILAYVYTEDQIFLQKELLQRGLARLYLASDFQMKPEFQEYETTAKDAGVGVWRKSAQGSSKSSSSKNSSSSSQSSQFIEEIPEQLIDSGSLIITEVYSHPKKTGTGAIELEEWIEVFNMSDELIDLSEVYISKSPSDTKKYKVQSGSVVDAQSYEVLFTQKLGLKLNNDGGELSLKNYDNSLIEYILYPKLNEGQSSADMSPDFHERTNWCSTLSPTPGSSNICLLPEVPVKKPQVKSASTSKSSKKTSSVTKKATAKKKSPLKVTMKYENVSSEDLEEGSGGQLIQGSVLSGPGSLGFSTGSLKQSFLLLSTALLGALCAHFYHQNANVYNKETIN